MRRPIHLQIRPTAAVCRGFRHVASVLLLVVAGLLAACATGPMRDAPRPWLESFVSPATWAQVSAATRAASAAAEEQARDYAQAAMQQWLERVHARTGTEFIPWATSYWTHQWLALKLAWYRMNDDSDGDISVATDRLAGYLQERYRETVIDPIAREISPGQIRDQATAQYVQALAMGIRALPGRFALPESELEQWLADIPAITVPPGASLLELVQAESVTRLAGYQALVAGTRGTNDGWGSEFPREAQQAVAQRTAERLVTALAIRGGATAASVLGGVPGVLLGIGVTAWDATAYEQERPALEAALRSDLDDTLQRVHRGLLQDPAHGVLAPVAHIGRSLAGASPDAPAQSEPGYLDGLF